MDYSRRQASWALLKIFVAVVIVRILLSHLFNGPRIFTDEFQFIEMARGLPQGQGMVWDGHQTYYPCWLYSLVIAPFVLHFEWQTAFEGIRWLNAILMALAILPSYALARELGGRRHALAAAGLIGLLPGMGYSPLVMSENLFFPIVMLAMWLLYRAALRPTVSNRLLAGLACGLGFHVKPHGLLLPIIAALTVLVFEAERLRSSRRNGQAGAKNLPLEYVSRVGRHWLTVVGWLIGVTPRILAVIMIERPDSTFNIQSFVGGYSGLAEGAKAFSLGLYALSLSGYLIAWVWTVGFLPAWVLGRECTRTLRGRNDDTVNLMVILTLVATCCMLALPARHTILNNAHWQIHERYFFMMLPLTLILFCMRAEFLDGGQRWKWIRLFVIVAVTTMAIRATFDIGWSMPSNSPSLTGPLLFTNPHDMGIVLVAAYILPGLIALILIVRKPGSPRRQWWAVALLFICFNIGWYGMHKIIGKWAQPDLEVAAKVDKQLKRHDQLLILHDGLREQIVWQAGMRNPGLEVYLEKDRRTGDGWWAHPLKLAPDGQILSPSPADSTWLLASNQWIINRKPRKAFADCSLYPLAGKEPLRFDLKQVDLCRKGKLMATPTDKNQLMKNIRLLCTQKELPPSWTLGKSAKIKMRLRNESMFMVPGKAGQLWLGYHWSDPKRLGNWKAVVWDDRHYKKIRRDLRTGEEWQTEFEIMAPPTAGDQWLLTICVFTMNGKLKIWSTNVCLSEWVSAKP